jgi:hypothetical protein
MATQKPTRVVNAIPAFQVPETPPIGNPNPDLPGTQDPEIPPQENSPHLPGRADGDGSLLGKFRRKGSGVRSSEDTGTFTSWVPGGDPEQVAALFGGLLVLALGMYAGLVKRKGGYFRMPSETERDDITVPLGRIAVRHLPMQLIGPDLKDIAESGAATHSYVTAGPLRRRPIPADDLNLPTGE